MEPKRTQASFSGFKVLRRAEGALTRTADSSHKRPQQVLTVHKLEQAVKLVKKDLNDLWVGARYQRGLAGIVFFSPSLKDHFARKKLDRQSPEPKAPIPCLLEVKKAETVLSPSPETSESRFPTKKGELRVYSPNPLFPTRKPTHYRMKHVPSPLVLSRRFLRTSPKASLDLDEVRCDLRLFENVERVISPLPTLNPQESCPLTALRSFEQQRSQSPDFPSFAQVQQPITTPSTPKHQPLLFRRFKQGRTSDEPKLFNPKWNEVCMKITKVSCQKTHKQTRSMQEQPTWMKPAVTQPQTRRRVIKTGHSYTKYAEARSESDSDLAIISGFS